MNRYILIFVLLFGCIASLFFVTSLGSKKVVKLKSKKQVLHSFPVTKELPFVIIIASYNNEKVVARNLRSVFEQDYSNYRIIYIDDHSIDKTYEKAQELIEKEEREKSVTLIHNEKNVGAMENFYRAIHSCKDEEIVVVLDGDDWFAHDGVLKRLNEVYANPDVWLTYGSYLSYPTYKKGECSKQIPQEVIQNNSIRAYSKKGVIASHLKTFYAALFKKIALQDLMLEGVFLPSTWDMAAMLPMIEMAAMHAQFIPEILYIYNRSNPLNDDKVNFNNQQKAWKHILSLPPYTPIKSWKQDSTSLPTLDFEEKMGSKQDVLQYIQTQEDKELLEFYTRCYQQHKNNSATKEELRILKTIHLIWLGPHDFPPESAQEVKKWALHHPDWKMVFWTDRERTAPYVNMQIKYVWDYPFYLLKSCYEKADNYFEKAAILRYEILFQEGGVCIDHDVQVLNSLAPFHYNCDFYCGLETLGSSILSSSLFPATHLVGAKARHPILEKSMQWLKQHWERLEGHYPGSSRNEVLSRAQHRIVCALEEGIRSNLTSPWDVVFPAAYFSFKQSPEALFTSHRHAGSWLPNEMSLLEQMGEHLYTMEQENHKALTAIILGCILQLAAFGFLIRRWKRRSV